MNQPSPSEDDSLDKAVALADEPVLRLTTAHVEPVAFELLRWFTRLLTDRHTFMIFDIGRTDRYVQVLTDAGHGVLAESVGDVHLPSNAKLTCTEHAELLRLGWNPPESGRHGDNWFRIWEPPDIPALTQLIALTMYRVHHLTNPSAVRIRAQRTTTNAG